jgi:Xaa-Pro aminopeptidase
MNIGRLQAGIPALNAGLYRRIRFLVGDPVAVVEVPSGQGYTSTLILRDIEMQRAKKSAKVDNVACPKEFEPSGGLSGDRETATAQSAAECLRRANVTKVIVDRSLPMIFAEMLRRASIEVQCDIEWGVLERRQKDEQELIWIQKAQSVTEEVMELACIMIARASADKTGQLVSDGQPLTSDYVRAKIDQWLIDRGYSNPSSIVASGPIGADCHNYGSGGIFTGQPVIVDIFPRDKTTLYNGDCTRTVVHGDIPDKVAEMHRAVVLAKAAATAATRAGVTGEQVHEATIKSIEASGFKMGLPPEGASPDFTSMTHGTGHGLGLEVHEPPLLDRGGPALLVGDVLTIEPGLYCPAIGGVRVEDMVVVTESGCRNFNRLPEGLRW